MLAVPRAVLDLDDVDRDAARAAFAEAAASGRATGLDADVMRATAYLTWLGALPATDAVVEIEGGLTTAEHLPAMETRLLLWRATSDPIHLREAKRLLDVLIEYAPPDCRESMLVNVQLHRQIAAAAREAGL